jgi:hypothetical protein
MDDQDSASRKESIQQDKECIAELKNLNSNMEKLIELENRKLALKERQFENK